MKIKFIFSLFVILNCFVFQTTNATESTKTTEEKKLPKICMIFDRAGKDDHSFNESAYNGFKTAQKNHLISDDSRIFEAKDDGQIQQATRSFAAANCDLIFGIGVNVAEPIKKLVNKYPKQKFVMVDYVVPGNNVQSIIYREDQAGFLIGAIAAMKSKTHKIGIIAGMDIPLVERFRLGYEAGAHYIEPKTKVITSFVGVSVDGWNNPTKAEEIALSQFNQDVDIIFQASGGSGIGVFNAAEKLDANGKQKKHFAIGCDSNQNWIKPGIILTSMIKSLDESVLNTIKDFRENKFISGTVVYGIENKGVDWAYDKYNKDLFTSSDILKINSIKSGIASGKITVPDYYKIR